MDGNLEKEKPFGDEQWIRLHRRVRYFEIMLFVILILCLVSLALIAVSFYLSS